MNLSQGDARFTEMGGATPLNTDKTVAHWHGQFTDPTDGRTYGYNMVGSDPKSVGATVTPTDIIPVNVVFRANPGHALNGADVVSRTAHSPIFESGDYGTTAHSGDYSTEAGTGAGELRRTTTVCSTRTRSCARSSTRWAPATT